MRCLVVLACAGLVACSPAATHEATRTTPEPEMTSAVAVPGACVDPSRDARRRFGTDASDGDMRVERTIDLDEDGTPDPFVAHPTFCGTGGCLWQLYVARGGCAHWVGELFGIWPLPSDARDHGLVDLEIAARKGCAGAERTESRARFDGTRYEISAARECHCLELDGTPGDDPPPSDAACDAWLPVTTATAP
jgi:hypothetical protein